MLTSPSSLSRSQLAADNSQLVGDVAPAAVNDPRRNESKKPPYQVDQQVKFLHLEAEVETLLQQMQSLKQQRQATTKDDAGTA